MVWFALVWIESGLAEQQAMGGGNFPGLGLLVSVSSRWWLPPWAHSSLSGPQLSEAQKPAALIQSFLAS